MYQLQVNLPGIVAWSVACSFRKQWSSDLFARPAHSLVEK